MNQEMKEIQDNVKAMITKFQEHNMVASIQVFITVKIGDNCAAYNHGGGDWYSRYGAISEWMETQRERIRVQVRKDEEE